MVCRREEREETSALSFVCMEVIEAGERARRARCAVGVEILYGALVLVRIWISGGCASATPTLYDHPP